MKRLCSAARRNSFIYRLGAWCVFVSAIRFYYSCDIALVFVPSELSFRAASIILVAPVNCVGNCIYIEAQLVLTTNHMKGDPIFVFMPLFPWSAVLSPMRALFFEGKTAIH